MQRGSPGSRSPLRSRRGYVGAAMVGAVLIMAVFAPWLSPYHPNAQNFAPLLPPSFAHPFGTDQLGRDEISRIIYGARVSVIVSFVGVAIGSSLGTILGLVAALKSGAIEALIMRITDILLAYPGIVLGIGIVALLGPGSAQIAIAVAIFNVPLFARLMHGAVLKEKTLEYVQATISLGASKWRLARYHLLPNAFPMVVPQLSLALGGGVLIEAALSFLGFGAQPPTASWGEMLSASRPYLSNAPLLAIVPGLALALFVIGFNLLGDTVRGSLSIRSQFGLRMSQRKDGTMTAEGPTEVVA